MQMEIIGVISDLLAAIRDGNMNRVRKEVCDSPGAILWFDSSICVKYVSTNNTVVGIGYCTAESRSQMILVWSGADRSGAVHGAKRGTGSSFIGEVVLKQGPCMFLWHLTGKTSVKSTARVLPY